MQLLFYLLVISIFLDFAAFEEVYKLSYHFYHLKLQYKDMYRVLLVIPAYLVVVVISFLIFFFFKFHLSLVFHNTTTIEALDPAVWVENKFKLSRMENWLQVFGENKILWFFPLLSESGIPKGDGLTWKTNEPDKNEFSNNNNTNNVVDNVPPNNFNFTFKRSNTPVNLPVIAEINNKHNLSHDYKSNGTAGVNIEMAKGKYGSNKASVFNDFNSTKGIFSPNATKFFSNDSKSVFK